VQVNVAPLAAVSVNVIVFAVATPAEAEGRI
jgi:hypothetical protein